MIINSNSCTTTNYWVKPDIAHIKIRAHGTTTSTSVFSVDPIVTGCQPATATYTIQWNNWDNNCSIEWGAASFEQSYLINKPMSAEEKENRIKKQFSKIIQSRCSPNIIVRQNTKRQPLTLHADVREHRARETLRRVVGDQKYINFIKNGFISVKGRSGLVYQIFTGYDITQVFNQGNLIERLCVVLQGNFPPTDSLIMRYLLILNNEQQFRSLALKHSISGHEPYRQINVPAEIKPLSELFKELKSKIA